MAFLQPQMPGPGRQPMFHVPGVVMGLIGALVAAHGVRALASPTLSDALINQYAFIPARYSRAFLASHDVDPGSLLDRAVPFVSYMGLHNDFTHLAINCLWLLAFGPIVARRYGAALFLAFFIICGIAGAGVHLALNMGSLVPVIGASAAISGLTAAGLRLLPAQRDMMLGLGGLHSGPMAPILSRQVLLFAAVWVGVNLAAGLTGMGAGGTVGLIAWQAHLGGFAAGLLLAGPFDRLARTRVQASL